MDYKDPKTLGKLMRKIMELRLTYYISADGVVMTPWQKGWEAYHIVAETDKRMDLT